MQSADEEERNSALLSVVDERSDFCFSDGGSLVLRILLPLCVCVQAKH